MKDKIISVFSSIGALVWGCFGGSCGIACIAGGCCGGTALLGFLSFSSSTMRIFEKLTPVFLGLTILSLGYAFYQAYKPKPIACCANNDNTGSNNCCNDVKKPSFFKSKSFLWIITLVCAIMWLYPLIFQSITKGQDSTQCCPGYTETDSLQNLNIIKISLLSE